LTGCVIEIPEHLVPQEFRDADLARPAIEFEGEVGDYNLVRVNGRVVAVSRALGPVELGVERLGERELAPAVLVGAELEEVRARAEAATAAGRRRAVESIASGARRVWSRRGDGSSTRPKPRPGKTGRAS
jgi:hypothetical protein